VSGSSAQQSSGDQREKPNFEQLLAALEMSVSDLEEGKIGLAEALARYEEAVGLLKECYQQLERAERKIEILSRLGSAGEAVTEPLQDAAESLAEKAVRRTKRRSRTVSPDSESDSGEIDAPRGLF
jgi:exodeoxyribonuclease VII small subunit